MIPVKVILRAALLAAIGFYFFYSSLFNCYNFLKWDPILLFIYWISVILIPLLVAMFIEYKKN